MHPNDVVAEGVAGGAEPVAVGAQVAGVGDVAGLDVLVEVSIVLGLIGTFGTLPHTRAPHHQPTDLRFEI
jgi:hypothetical protein